MSESSVLENGIHKADLCPICFYPGEEIVRGEIKTMQGFGHHMSTCALRFCARSLSRIFWGELEGPSVYEIIACTCH